MKNDLLKKRIEENSRRIDELGHKLETGEISIEECAEELIKMRILPDEKSAERKTELRRHRCGYALQAGTSGAKSLCHSRPASWGGAGIQLASY